MSWRCGGNGWIGSPAMTNCVSDWVNIIDDMVGTTNTYYNFDNNNF